MPMLGELFYIARQRYGYTQREAASAVQITQAYLSMIERNVCTPRPAVLNRLITLYRLTKKEVRIALAGRQPCRRPVTPRRPPC